MAIERVFATFVAFIFLAAAASKVADPSAIAGVFAHLTQEWIASSHWMITGAIAGLAAWEAFLGICLLAQQGSRRVLFLGLLTLLIFTSVLVYLTFDRSAPACGCIGLFGVGERISRESQVGIVRNVALMWILAGLWRQSGRHLHGGTNAGDAVAVPLPSRADGRGGFTIIELLIVVFITGVLVGLTLPSLSRARETSRSVSSLSSQRQLAAIIGSYSLDYADALPYFQTPGDPHGPMRLPEFELGPNRSYFMGGSVYWPNLLRPAYIDGALSHAMNMTGDVFGSNKSENYPPDTVRSRYLLTHTVFATPLYWRGDKAPVGFGHFRHTRQSDLMFPGQKAVLLDIGAGLFSPHRRHSTNRGTDALVSRFDGSAGVLVWWQHGNPLVVQRGYGAWTWPVLATRDGLHGRDF
jgi:prepilin-type N-terminal cleavage/methylation domain-containing protein